MITKSFISAFFIAATFAGITLAHAQSCPTRLTTSLLEHTDCVWEQGKLSTLPLEQQNTAIENLQMAKIHDAHPMLSWVVPSSGNGTMQTAYRIIVAKSRKALDRDSADVWDSGRSVSGKSIAVALDPSGKGLEPNTVYYWKVKTWDNHGKESDFSAPRAFITSDKLDGSIARYPLVVSEQHPVKITANFIDFGKAAFGRLYFTANASNDNDTIEIRLGEKSKNGHVDMKPGGSIRQASYKIALRKGQHDYAIRFTPDPRNTNTTHKFSTSLPILMPDYIGEVFPFRYVEFVGYNKPIENGDVTRYAVNYPFDDEASNFECSDTVINKVWEMCKHTIKATSFAGTYVDGDRERIPYEADAVLNQLGHYSVDREFSMARHSADYLLHNPTWPTEWNLEQVLLHWLDYLYTGDTTLIASAYEELKPKAMMALRETNGLISTRKGKIDTQFLNSINYHGSGFRDIVDWPQAGAAGNEKENGGEADGYVLTDFNTVVNAWHYKACELLGKIADAIGKKEEAKQWLAEAENVKKAMNTLLFDKVRGVYRDGIDTEHASQHANMMPLALGIVPKENVNSVVEFIKSRKIACSVYGAQFLLDALYASNNGDYAQQILSSTEKRSWYNMIRLGSTIALEAWDPVYKANLDWNHAWGAAPANVIPRGLMGITPTSPAYSTFTVKPQIGNLKFANITLPTIIGNIKVEVEKTEASYTCSVDVPANSQATIIVPRISKKDVVSLDGKNTKSMKDSYGYSIIVGSGKHTVLVEPKK